MPTSKRKGATAPLSTPNANGGVARTGDKSEQFGVPRAPQLYYLFSQVAIHTTLWTFSALFLPRTTLLAELIDTEWDQTQVTSRDRPQHAFLDPLTKHPAITVASICVGAAVLQAWWAGALRDSWINASLVGSDEDKRMERAFHSQRKLRAFRNAFLATLTATFAVHIVLILFGAPIASLKLKTYLLALLVSIMVVFPPAYVWGIPSFGGQDPLLIIRSRLSVSRLSPRKPIQRALIYPVVGTCLGGWLGVIPIALDWDRPWQAWPLTPAYGAILGYIVASLAALTVTAITEAAQEYERSQVAAAAAAESKSKRK